MVPLFPPNAEMIAFLRACKETPEDNAPRLVFADYLEENGHPERAELIRLQCALALFENSDNQTDWDCKQHQALLFCRQEQLLKRFQDDWCRPWKRLICAQYVKYDYRGERKLLSSRIADRGLVNLTFTPKSFLSSCQILHDPSYFAWVEKISLVEMTNTHSREVIKHLAQANYLNSLAFIRRSPSSGIFDSSALWESPNATSIKALDIDVTLLRQCDYQSLIYSKQLNNLRRLRLTRIGATNQTEESLMTDLYQCDYLLPSLNHLHLIHMPLHHAVYEGLRSRFGNHLITEPTIIY